MGPKVANGHVLVKEIWRHAKSPNDSEHITRTRIRLRHLWIAETTMNRDTKLRKITLGRNKTVGVYYAIKGDDWECMETASKNEWKRSNIPTETTWTEWMMTMKGEHTACKNASKREPAATSTAIKRERNWFAEKLIHCYGSPSMFNRCNYD